MPQSSNTEDIGSLTNQHSDVEPAPRFNLARIELWFDQLELVLETEAKQAGLFEHGSMTGTAREFLVKRVLRSVLPRLVHIGSGKVIDAYGNSSKQIDVILYDSRFPVLEVECGIGLYMIEGVIATIEVKSTITKKGLFEALDNAKSIIALTPHFETAPWRDHAVTRAATQGLSSDEALRRVTFESMPAAYVFGYSTRLRKKALAFAIAEWFDSRERPAVSGGRCPVLPRIIVAGKTIGVLDDGFYRPDPPAETWSEWRSKHGDSVRHLMSTWDMNRRFGFLLSHVIAVATNRLGLSHSVSGAKYDVRQYLPVLNYVKQEMADRKSWHIPWEQSRARGNDSDSKAQPRQGDGKPI